MVVVRPSTLTLGKPPRARGRSAVELLLVIVPRYLLVRDSLCHPTA
eukprot:CAMPEP_0182528400 /NCGR_PEP_ID=MMETSP1323-20130603/4477_1 /TAXON_ID=236787 /ORGANISM="Florenciella parvula, Strain RCC1693" /LENGTH=45 /DNA_ID= /DNA_START= /DNA_END= /DNA_ORIENTATION=